MKRSILPYIPVGVIALAIIAIYAYGLTHEISFNTIQTQHEKWKNFASTHPLLSAFYFLTVLILSVCFLIPDSILLGVMAGFLFPLPLAMLYILIGETVGAWLYFEAIRLAFFKPLHRSHHTVLLTIEKKIAFSPASYLLFFRLSHMIPYWIINTAAACFKIKRWTFLWTTCLGMLPLAYILAEAGARLNVMFETQTHFNLSAVFTYKITFMLIGIAMLTLIPLIWKYCKQK